MTQRINNINERNKINYQSALQIINPKLYKLMKTSTKVFVFCLFVAFFNFNDVLAQNSRKWEGGLFVGLSNYGGDLISESLPLLVESHMSIGGMLKYNISSKLTMRTNLIWNDIRFRSRQCK